MPTPAWPLPPPYQRWSTPRQFGLPARRWAVTSTVRKYCSSGKQKLGPKSICSPSRKSRYVWAAATYAVARTTVPAGGVHTERR